MSLTPADIAQIQAMIDTAASPWTVGQGFPDVVATVFQAGDTIITAAGLFTYNGPPGPGNPPIFSVVAPGVVKDPFGNTVASLLNAGSLAGGHFGIGSDGTVFISNAAGKTVIRIDTATGSIWCYNSAGEGAGNLITSIAPAAGIDRAGNPYNAGVEIQGAGDAGQSILLTLVGGVAELQMPTGTTYEGFPANIFTGIVGSALTQFMATGVSGPKTNVAAHADWVQDQWNSSNAGGTSSANRQWVYIDEAGTPHGVASFDASGMNIQAASGIYGVQPGTGTVATPAVRDNWNAIATSPGYSNAWGDTVGPVPRGQYRMIGSPPNTVEVTGDITHAAIAGSSIVCTLPLGYRPTNQHIRPLGFLVCTAGFANAANPPLVTLATNGNLILQSLPAGTTRVAFHCLFSLDA